TSRCFPHIVNLAVKAGLAHLTQLNIFEDNEIDTDISILISNPMYVQLLQDDTIKRARQLVHFIRDSGQRREDFIAVIKKDNEDGSWGKDSEGKNIELRVVGLLKDVDTRWSSTFFMVDRVIELRLAINAFFDLDKYKDFDFSYNMSEEQYAVLHDIRQFLHVFHVVQELVSAEKTPTLSIILPMYETLVTMLKDLKKVLPVISGAIAASQAKLQEYLQKSRGTTAYTAAIGTSLRTPRGLEILIIAFTVINPTMKLEWLRKNWSEADYSSARDRIFEAVSLAAPRI
ncbi:hypothetical protein FA13DRAFT_1653250, partial [Coprinellus micaceus]